MQLYLSSRYSLQYHATFSAHSSGASTQVFCSFSHSFFFFFSSHRGIFSSSIILKSPTGRLLLHIIKIKHLVFIIQTRKIEKKSVCKWEYNIKLKMCWCISKKENLRLSPVASRDDWLLYFSLSLCNKEDIKLFFTLVITIHIFYSC